MEEKNEWVFFRDIDWECPKNNRFNVDTRDFHCGYFWSEEKHPDFETINKYPHFFHTKEELINLLERYFKESGGKCEWRFFSLDTYGDTWLLKYLRIFRTELGYVICDSNNHALKKQILSGKVDQKYLCDH
jgi:hypothetical protein